MRRRYVHAGQSALSAVNCSRRQAEMIRLAVEGCRRNGIHSGLCGQAPSDYPEMAEFLVELGIDSMSLNPDTVLKTTRRVLELEARLGEARAGAGADGRRTAPVS